VAANRVGKTGLLVRRDNTRYQCLYALTQPAVSQSACNARCHAGSIRQQPNAFLSLEQLSGLEPLDKVVIDVSNITGQQCHIHALAGHIVAGVRNAAEGREAMGTKMMLHLHKAAMKDVKKHNPEQLYHKMNSGTDEDLLRWQQFGRLCVQIATCQHALNGTPIRVWADDEELLPAKRTVRERCGSFE
jgi:hypothetical protein